MKLSKTVQNIILGLLLGDGSFEKKKDTIGIRLQIKQKAQAKEYVEWLYGHLKDFCLSGIKFKEDANQYYFSTRYIREFKNLYNLFYPNGKKIIPQNIDTMLVSPISLAVWYMDDGSLDFRIKDHYAFYLASNCFSLGDSQRLADVLLKNFGVDARVYNNLCRGKRYPRIYIGSQGRERFRQLVESHIQSCFSYKLPNYT